MKRTLATLVGALIISACQSISTPNTAEQRAANTRAEVLPDYPLAPAVSAGCQAEELPFDCDRRAILAMAGEYQVDFHFEEIAGFRPGYPIHAPHDSRGFEFIKVIEDSGRRIVLQHVLVSKEGDVVKHWRQDWEYEQGNTWQFAGDKTWQRRALPAADIAGSWTQTVWQVDDSPRYAGYGRWRHRGNTSSWLSDETWRPLPRREFTTRNDYDVLVAVNRQEITSTGWLHLQENLKFDRNAAPTASYLAREIGIDRYTRIRGYDFSAGYAYLAKTAAFWQVVRAAWSERLAAAEQIRMADKIGDKTLWMAIFDRAGQPLPATAAELKQEVDRILDQYLRSPATDVVAAVEAVTP